MNDAEPYIAAVADVSLSCALEEIREWISAAFTYDDWHRAARDDVPRLLAAVGAVLELHQPKPVYGLADDGNGKSLCGHSMNYDGDAHFEGDDGYWYCRDKKSGDRCSSCADEDAADLWADWPCPTYLAITREIIKGEK